jgi:hypothetical protein
MLNSDERRALIRIEVSLASDPEFSRRFRAAQATLHRPRRRPDVSIWRRVLVVVGVCAMVASMLSHSLPAMIFAIAASALGLWRSNGAMTGDRTPAEPRRRHRIVSR